MIALSAVVLAVLGVFLTSSPEYVLAVTSSAAPIPGKTIVLYGKEITDTGVGVKYARVTIFDESTVNGTRAHRPEHYFYTNTRGLWRGSFSEPSHSISVMFLVNVNGKLVRSPMPVRTIAPGHAYQFSVKLIKRTRFYFFPLTSY